MDGDVLADVCLAVVFAKMACHPTPVPKEACICVNTDEHRLELYGRGHSVSVGRRIVPTMYLLVTQIAQFNGIEVTLPGERVGPK